VGSRGNAVREKDGALGRALVGLADLGETPAGLSWPGANARGRNLT
jgi:hypothetical protein